MKVKTLVICALGACTLASAIIACAVGLNALLMSVMFFSAAIIGKLAKPKTAIYVCGAASLIYICCAAVRQTHYPLTLSDVFALASLPLFASFISAFTQETGGFWGNILSDEKIVSEEKISSSALPTDACNAESLERARLILTHLRVILRRFSKKQNDRYLKSSFVNLVRKKTRADIALFFTHKNGSLVLECASSLPEETDARKIWTGTCFDKLFKLGQKWVGEEGENVSCPGVLPDGLKYAAAVILPNSCEENYSGILYFARKDDGKFTDEQMDAAEILASEAAIFVGIHRLYDELELSYSEIIQALAQAIEAKDPYTHGHVERVKSYAVKLGNALNLSKLELDHISKAALLHDVGKIYIPDSILLKPGALSEDEQATMKAHTTAAAELLKDIHSLSSEVLEMVVHHHERYDGKGYPDSLSGDLISRGARIIAIADAFDAMTSDRPYRSGFALNDALDRLKQAKRSQFDPEYVDAFVRLFEDEYCRQEMMAVFDSKEGSNRK